MKLVNESLNELYKFQKKSNPLNSLGIGKKALIKKWLHENRVTHCVINDDYNTINGTMWVDISSKELTKIPDYIQFNIIEGSFFCMNNKLTSLKGCPKIVKGDFSCSINQLSNLEGCPLEVYGNFFAYGNKKQFTEEDVRKICKVHKHILVTDM